MISKTFDTFTRYAVVCVISLGYAYSLYEFASVPF